MIHASDDAFGGRIQVAVLVLACLAAIPTPVLAQDVLHPMTYGVTVFDQLEYVRVEGEDAVGWEVTGWWGGDYTRFWYKSEGSLQATGARTGEGEVQLLYSRLVSPFWELQAGVRLEGVRTSAEKDGRAFLVLGLEGLAPYLFEVEPAVFVSASGDISGRFTGTYDLYVTQRLIAQGRLEVNASAQRVEAFGIGSGLNDVGLDARFRYEIRRKFAPYFGFRWTRKFGETADFARFEGGSASSFSLVAGVRVWR